MLEERTASPEMSFPRAARQRGVWDSVRSHWLLVLFSVVVFTGAGLAAGLIRHPRYSANARLAVLHVNFGSAGALSGFSTASAALADTYARSIQADGIVNPLAAHFRVRPGTIKSELSAVGVPQSPVFIVTAATPSPRSAVALANAASQQLLTYEQAVNSINPDSRRLYDQLVKAEGSLAAQQETLDGVLASTSAAAAASPTHALSGAQRLTVARTEANVAVARDEVTAVRAAYQQTVVGTSSTQYVQPLVSAIGAHSDRNSRLILLMFGGLAVGLAVGVLLAVLEDARRGPRRA